MRRVYGAKLQQPPASHVYACTWPEAGASVSFTFAIRGLGYLFFHNQNIQ